LERFLKSRFLTSLLPFLTFTPFSNNGSTSSQPNKGGNQGSTKPGHHSEDVATVIVKHVRSWVGMSGDEEERLAMRR